jgi:bifunctional DNase/RNase
MLPVEVAFISYDPRAQLAVVFLREHAAASTPAPQPSPGAPAEQEAPPRRLLPIWIGLAEAHAIYAKLEGKEPARPMTHDLLATVIGTLGASIRRIVVHSLKEDVFHGRIEVEADGRVVDVDSRPSDAIALAVRVGAPIFVETTVMEHSAISEDDIRDLERHSLKDTLEALDEESYVKV